MGKRLTCPRCSASIVYDVPEDEASAPLQEIRCRPCGHRFSYGFAAEYVTEPEPQEPQARAEAPDDIGIEYDAACRRLALHVARYPEYLDRDRDLLMLCLLDTGNQVRQDLAMIQRSIDVILKRGGR